MGRSATSSTRRSRSSTSTRSDRRCRRHRHPHGQRAGAATKSAVSRASAAPGSSTAAFTPRCIPTSRTSTARAHAVVKGDGDLVWPNAVVATALPAIRSASTTAGASSGDEFVSARWDLLPEGRYMWASVQTVRGCPKHCSFCSVWRTDGQEPRQREVDRVVREVVELRRLGFRFIALADDNFYPVTFDDLAQARRRSDPDAAARARSAAPGAVRADGGARAAAERHRVLHADHDGSGRGPGVSRGDAATRASAARSSASNR